MSVLMLQNPSAEANEETSRTFADVLTLRASDSADQTAFTMLSDGEEVAESVTYGSLHARALSAAVKLTAAGKPGDRAILMFPQGIEFIVALFGCFYSGIIPVPVSLPKRRGKLEALASIVRDAGATLLLATDEARAFENTGNPEVDALLRLDSLTCAAASHAHYWRSRSGSPGDVALLQYTSGSTGNPRGVAVTHRNLLANHDEIQASLGTHRQSRIVSWLPMFHDMGLGMMLAAVWAGARCVLMSPHSFLQKPGRWLQAISKHRGTISGGPDFAYELCTRRVAAQEMEDLDLSCWRVAFNGSEPIRATTLERFSRAFVGRGFAASAFHPVYGLAESTVFACSPPPSSAPTVRRFSRSGLLNGLGITSLGENTTALVGCGASFGTTRLEVVDPETKDYVGPGRIGELWLQGNSVATGYWENSEATTATFGARSSSGDGPFLRTGDLGFRLGDHIFITGRLKDLIIIRGANHYPQDIEASVSACHPALQPYACAAVSLDGGDGERLVVIQEVARSELRSFDAEAVFRAVRRVVAQEHGLQVYTIALVRPASLPRTTSGKVRRRTCLREFIGNQLSVVASWGAEPVPFDPSEPPQTLGSGAVLAGPESTPKTAGQWQRWIAAWLSQRLNVRTEEVDPGRPLAELGLDSAAAVELAQALSEKAERHFEETLLFEAPTVFALCNLLVGQTELPAPPAVVAPKSQPETHLEEELERLERELEGGSGGR